MADDEQPQPFRRERNLSNRNFNKRSSNRRRFSTESHNSVDSRIHNVTNAQDESKTQNFTNENDTLTANSVNILNSLRKMPSLDIKSDDADVADHMQNMYSGQINGDSVRQLDHEIVTTPLTSDPALLDVKQKLLLFENLQHDDRILFKTSKYKSKSSHSLLPGERENSSGSVSSLTTTSGSYLVKVYPTSNSDSPEDVIYTAGVHSSIDEEHSEDDVDSIRDEVDVAAVGETKNLVLDEFARTSSLDESKLNKDTIPVAAINKSFLTPIFQHSTSHTEEFNKAKGNDGSGPAAAKRNKDFPRNYRSRPKTEVIECSSEHLLREGTNFNSLRIKSNQSELDDEEQIELRDKSFDFVQPILEELIKTEESYVENLWLGINNYGNIFQRSDLPIGLRGKKYVLFGNVEQIAEFHRDEFLPMLHRNKHDLKRIFDEFKQFIDSNCFYGYVLFTMNKQRSLKLCDVYKNYFKLLQNEIDDKLGINSFLVQPIQRMARYPLLLQQFITTLFKNRDYVIKPIIESCCRLEKKLRNLLVTTNESEIINDIVCLCDAHEFNTFYQGKFRKVSEFQVFDHTLRRSYRSKVFIFDKCIIYTEIKGKQLIFHGRYPCEHIGIAAKTKQFTLYYDQRKQQECDFIGDQALIDQWLDLIRDMISAYAAEERRKLKELHSHEYANGDHMHRKPANLSLFRDSNRFSTDSGIGNIWVIPKPEQEEAISNRTTWYAVT